MGDALKRRTGGRSATIEDVAEAAGVSRQTVSRVINNGPNVRDAVKERVEAAIARLGYVPSLAARRMGGSKSYLLLALNDLDRTVAGWKSREGTDWVDQMLLGGMLTCREHGYRLLVELVDTHSSHVEREVQAAIAAVRPDGVILTPPHSENPAITDLLTRLNLPFARIGSTAAGDGYSVSMDDALAAEVATDHLLDLGHVRVGFVTGSDEYALSAARLEGYRRAMSKRGLPADESLIAHGDFTYRSGLDAANALLDLPEPATGVVASNDQMALATLRVAADRGLTVPDRLSIVSFDDTPIVRMSHPPFTAVVQPIAELTAEAARLLIQHRPGVATPPPSRVSFDFAVRGSSAPPAA